MKYAKHIIAASIATLIVGCSSESEPAPENQRPTITLPEGSTYDVSEGGAVTVEFDVQDEGAVSVAALNPKLRSDPVLRPRLISGGRFAFQIQLW